MSLSVEKQNKEKKGKEKHTDWYRLAAQLKSLKYLLCYWPVSAVKVQRPAIIISITTLHFIISVTSNTDRGPHGCLSCLLQTSPLIFLFNRLYLLYLSVHNIIYANKVCVIKRKKYIFLGSLFLQDKWMNVYFSFSIIHWIDLLAGPPGGRHLSFLIYQNQQRQ